MGDTWTFRVGRTVLPKETPVTADLGALVVGEDYHGILTARVTWEDPAGVPFLRTIGLEIALMAYDAAGVVMAGWDNDLLISQDRQYMTDGTARREDVSLITQAIVQPPAGAATLKLAMTYFTGDDAGSLVVEEAVLIFTVVTPVV